MNSNIVTVTVSLALFCPSMSTVRGRADIVESHCVLSGETEQKVLNSISSASVQGENDMLLITKSF